MSRQEYERERKKIPREGSVGKFLCRVRVFVARSDCGPTHAPGLARWARGWWLPLALALALSACAAPISVTRVDPQTVHQELTRNSKR